MDPQQQVRLLIGNLTVDNILLNGRVQELEGKLAEALAELVQVREQQAGKP